MKLIQIKSLLTTLLIFTFISCENTDITSETNTTRETVEKASGGKITVNLNSTGKTASFFGAGHYFWSGHLMNGISNKNNAHNWIWRDLNVNVTRIVLRAGAEKTNDNNNPDNLNFSAFDFTSNSNNVDQIAAVKKAKEKKSNIKVWAVVLSPPNFLKTNNSELGGGTLRYINFDTEFKEFAEFITAHLKHLKNEGVIVDYLSIMNEPDIDLDHEDASFDPDWAWWTYRKTIPFLISKLNSENIKIPIIAGAETLSVGNADTYIDKVKNAYSNTGVFTTHQYGGNTGSNWRDAANAAGSKPLIMSEYHTGHGQGNNPPDLTSGLNLSQKMIDAFRNGASGYLNFEWGGPGANFTGLLRTPWGQNAERKKNYYTYKQFTDGILNKKVVNPSTSGISNFSSANTIAFTSGRTVYIHVMNWNSDGQYNVRVEIGKTIKDIEIWRTSQNENRKSIWSQSNVNLNYYNVNFAPRSMITMKITW